MRTISVRLVCASLFLLSATASAATSSVRVGAFRLQKPVASCVGSNVQVSLSWGTAANARTHAVERKGPSERLWTRISPALRRTVSFADAWSNRSGARYASYRIVAMNDRSKRSSNTVRVILPSCTVRASSSGSTSRMGKLWGAYVGSELRDAAEFEARIGAPMNLQAVFVDDSDPFPSAYGPTVRDKGKTLVVFWEPSLSLDAIIAGDADISLQRFATDAKTYGGPVIFAPFHEMNGDWSSWGGTVGNNTPAKLIASWKRVHGLLSGATNMQFAWVVNNDSVPDTPANAFAAYYPGDAYVDVVGVDGFNFGDPWQTFDELFGDSLRELSSYDKPLYIFSMASAEGLRKAAWIADTLGTQIARHPEVEGWIWFNEDKEHDWRVWSDPDSLKAFQDVVQQQKR